MISSDLEEICRKLYDLKTAAYGADFAVMVLEVLRRHLKQPNEITLLGVEHLAYPNNYIDLVATALGREYTIHGPQKINLNGLNGDVSERFMPFASLCINKSCMLVDVHISRFVRRYLEALRNIGASRQLYVYPNPLEAGRRGGVFELSDDILYELSPIGKGQVKISD